MNNRFKYRALTPSGKLVYFSILDVKQGGLVTVDDVSFYLEKCDRIDQCTASEDRNGRLIYESDVLDMYRSTEQGTDPVYRAEVRFKDGSYYVYNGESNAYVNMMGLADSEWFAEVVDINPTT